VIAKYKKIIAREVLILLVSCFCVSLVYGYLAFHNWRSEVKSAEMWKEEGDLRSNEDLILFNDKKRIRIEFFEQYRYHCMYRRIDVSPDAYYKFWETIFSWANENNQKENWSNYTSNKDFIEFNVDQGLEKPADLFRFAKSVYWTNLEVENVQNIINRLSRLEKEHRSLRYFSDDQVRKYCMYAIYSVFGVVFVLRYIIFLTLWSVRTLRDKSQNS
jgi:hypothetical protein